MTWNVRSLRDDREVLAATVRAMAPDVLALQEAPRHWRATTVLAGLARQTHLLYACGGRSGAGTALLTSLRVDVEDARAVRFPVTRGLAARGVAAARVRVAGLPVVVASVHLGLRSSERRDHATRIRALVDELAGPSADVRRVVAGDLNEQPGGSAWRRLADGLGDSGASGGPTFPACAPQARIDAVLVDRRWVGRPVPVGEVSRASDHLPVVVDLWPEGASGL